MTTSSEGTAYSVPAEAEVLFHYGILKNARVTNLPLEFEKYATRVHFNGSDLPRIPINWRFAESLAALKAFEATMLNVLRSRKYACDASEININTDHASLFIMTPFLTKVATPGGQEKEANFFYPEVVKKLGFTSTDLHRCKASNHRALASNIYRTEGSRYYHIHASMNPDPTLSALGLPSEAPRNESDSYEMVVERFQSVLSKTDPYELDHRINEKFRQAGTIAWTTEEYLTSPHGQANAHVGLYEMHAAHTGHAPCWWPNDNSLPSSAKRPLAGLRVLDLTRVIAAPTITRSLAEMGASVMRVTGPVTDFGGTLPDLNWGKWNCKLDINHLDDRNRLIALIQGADVVVESYRPGVMERKGFGREAIFGMIKGRSRGGIVHVRVNCYGWHGPWKHRSGWQQVSDANCGVSMRFGEAMGLHEAVTPVFPNSDYCTGIIGSTAVLHSLIRRSETGGSYGIDTALNYYSQWLVKDVGEYTSHIWSQMWQRYGCPVFRHYTIMDHSLKEMIDLLKKHDDDHKLFSPEYFERRVSRAIGQTLVELKPVARWVDDVLLGYNVGTRPNGFDAARWPEDLSAEVVT